MGRVEIYCKTPKGAAEVAQRSHHLAARLRSVLILIDGRTPLHELEARLMTPAEDLQAALRLLLDEGYVSPLTH